MITDQNFKRVCPKCGSLEIKSDTSLYRTTFAGSGTRTPWMCVDCGYTAPVFPEVEDKDVEEFVEKIISKK